MVEYENVSLEIDGLVSEMGGLVFDIMEEREKENLSYLAEKAIARRDLEFFFRHSHELENLETNKDRLKKVFCKCWRFGLVGYTLRRGRLEVNANELFIIWNLVINGRGYNTIKYEAMASHSMNEMLDEKLRNLEIVSDDSDGDDVTLEPCFEELDPADAVLWGVDSHHHKTRIWKPKK